MIKIKGNMFRSLGIALVIQFIGFFVIFVHCAWDPLPWDDLPLEWNLEGIPVFHSFLLLLL